MSVRQICNRNRGENTLTSLSFFRYTFESMESRNISERNGIELSSETELCLRQYFLRCNLQVPGYVWLMSRVEKPHMV